MGFSAKLPIRNPQGFTHPFDDVLSVSDCNRQTPIEGFREFDEWYETGFVKSEQALIRAIQLEKEWGLDQTRSLEYKTIHGVSPPGPYTLLAYRICPIWFNSRGVQTGLHHAVHPPLLAHPPDLSTYERAGYDLANIAHGAVGCSPLFCNSLANEITVNRYCLLDTLDQAMEVGQHFGAEQPEPGDYVLFEVWHKAH